MLSFLFAHLARILAHGVAVRGNGRTIVPVPASCVANRLEKLILEKDWKEASGGLASFSSFQRLFGRLFSSGAAPACSPYLRQLS